MANTWNVAANGAVTLNGTAIPNTYFVKVALEWNTELSKIETYIEVEAPNVSEDNAIDQVLAVLPGSPTYASLGGYTPRTLYRSALGDTISLAAISVVQQNTRPDKLGV
jgi:hypothetical protein